jgi:hypothetical protein
LIGASNALFTEAGTLPMLGDQPEYERIVAQIRQRLDEPAFLALRAEGEKLGWDEAVAYALRVGTDTTSLD